MQDDPDDHINSGTPAQPQPGFSSRFDVGTGIFPTPPQGRALPLGYKITASYNYNGTPVTASRRIKQDEIDKCRQEYVDIGVDFSGISRSRFTMGTDKDFFQDVKDCYAFIYPTRAAEALALTSKFTRTKISSGYRSPRSNLALYNDKTPIPSAAKTSRHMFGDAVDIKYLSAPKDWKGLWDDAVEPKILEAPGAVPMLLKKTTAPADVKEPYSEPSLYDQANCLHLGR